MSAAQFEETKRIVGGFSKPGGEGERLQAQLERRAREKHAQGKSWLEEWWLVMAYHLWKDPTVITSNWYATYADHPVAAHTPVHQITRATSLIKGFLVSKTLLQHQALPPDTSRKKPLCMDQYTRIYANTRIPGDKVPDTTVTHPIHECRHIVVLRKDQIFQVEVFDQQGEQIPDAHLQAQLRWIMEETETIADQLPIGVLTGERRDVWARAREKLLASQVNKANLDIIERALFAVCLDESSPEGHSELLQVCFHNHTGRNRWFDKGFSVIVCRNGRGGINSEHSPLDAPALAHGCSMFAAYYEDRDEYVALRAQLDSPRPANLPTPRKLTWEVSQETRRSVHEAGVNVARFISTYHTELLEFEGYGTNFLKEQKLSPDAFIQMVIQLAYFKCHKTVTATYETAQTRKFFHGRTETVRTLSNASKKFVEGMENPALSPADKYKLFTQAIESHNGYMLDASEGKAVDRHLLGLMMCSAENGEPRPAIFNDPSFTITRTFRLSTSNLTPAPAFFGGFGPVVDDGYGVCYALRDCGLWFSVSSRTSCPSTDTDMMRRAIKFSLEDLKALCLAVKGQPKL